MKEQDKIIKHISLIKFKDPRIIQQVVYHPILFAKHVMADPDDYRPIRIRYFGAFVGKFMRNKEMHMKLSYIIQAIKSDPKLIRIFIDPSFDDDLMARKYVNQLFDESNKDAINDIYDTIVKVASSSITVVKAIKNE